MVYAILITAMLSPLLLNDTRESFKPEFALRGRHSDIADPRSIVVLTKQVLGRVDGSRWDSPE